MPLADRVALVTGASRGIGRAIAEELAEQGATVIGTATTEQGVETIHNFLKEKQLKGAGFKLNVCDVATIKSTLAEITKQYGNPTILINNAGVTRDNILFRMKSEQWDEVINTNLNSIFYLTQACLKGMLKARWGRIVNISSVVAVTGNPGQANYCAAKAGIIGFTKSLAQELAPINVTANAVAPGFIDTDMTRQLDEKQKDAINKMIPMGRMGEAKDVAGAVAFLVSDAAAYITGQTLHVNGGMCMV